MESIVQNPTLAFIAIIITGILASLPGVYATWTQRKRIRAEGAKESAEATEIIGRAYQQLQAQYKEMIIAIKESYEECSGKIDLLTLEVEELRKENKQLIKENADFCKQIKALEGYIEDLIEELSKEEINGKP
jgi:FtsZ-binding cell division protein ZapB